MVQITAENLDACMFVDSDGNVLRFGHHPLCAHARHQDARDRQALPAFDRDQGTCWLASIGRGDGEPRRTGKSIRRRQCARGPDPGRCRGVRYDGLTCHSGLHSVRGWLVLPAESA